MGEGTSQGMMVLIGVIIYMIIMLSIGIWSSRQIKTATDYIVAGRRLGLPLVTGTLVATWFCAGTVMGSPSQSYLFGNQGTIFDPWSAALCLILAGLLFSRLMRRGRFMTAADFFDIRYGKKMGVIAAIVLIIAQMGWVGSMLVAFGVILQYFSGLPLAWGIIISTIVVVAYTYMGGMWSVTLTDLFQVCLLTIAMIIMLPIAIAHVGGWSAFVTNAANWAELPTFALTPTADAGYLGYLGAPGWIYYIGAWLSIGFGSLCSQDLMQRTLSAKDEKTTVYGAYLSGIVYLTVGMIPVLLGIIAFEVYPDLTIADTEMIMPMLAVKFLPPVLMVIFVAGIVAAIMSSCDSALLAAASIMGYNVLRYFRPDAGDELELKTTRICVPIVTVASLLIALYLETIYMLMVIAWTWMLVSLIAPYAAGYFWRKANESGAIAALIAGFGSWVGFIYYYLPLTTEANIGVIEEGVVYMDWALWDAVYMGSVPAFIVSIVALIVVSLVTQKIDTPKPLADIDGKPLKLINWTGWGFGKGKSPETLDTKAG